MKIIFLDIDGVLNCEETCLARLQKQKNNAPLGYLYEMQEGQGWYLDIDEEMVQRVGKIVKLTDAKVCLTSTHRLDWMYGRDKLENLSSKTLQYLFDKYNIEIIGITPGVTNGIDQYIYPGGWREDQIKAWLNERDDIESFCVIDDEDEDLQSLKDYLVKTTFYKNEFDDGGLRKSHISQAVKILEKTKKINQNKK